MSARVGAPTHRVLRVVLDKYLQQLPESSRTKVEEMARRLRERREH